MKHDPLADVFTAIRNAESLGKDECSVNASKVSEGILNVMKDDGYIGGFKPHDGMFRIQLSGKVNNCGVVRPRFSVKVADIFKWEKRFLPAAGIGILLISTPKGIVDQRAAAKHNAGGRLLGYVY